MTAVWITSPKSTPPPLKLIPLGGWRDDAACAHHPKLPPSTWDDDGTNESGPNKRNHRIGAAIAVCRTCPVRQPCLADVDLDYDRGVRGGIDLRLLLVARQAAV